MQLLSVTLLGRGILSHSDAKINTPMTGSVWENFPWTWVCEIVKHFKSVPRAHWIFMKMIQKPNTKSSADSLPLSNELINKWKTFKDISLRSPHAPESDRRWTLEGLSLPSALQSSWRVSILCVSSTPKYKETESAAAFLGSASHSISRGRE